MSVNNPFKWFLKGILAMTHTVFNKKFDNGVNE